MKLSLFIVDIIVAKETPKKSLKTVSELIRKLRKLIVYEVSIQKLVLLMCIQLQAIE